MLKALPSSGISDYIKIRKDNSLKNNNEGTRIKPKKVKWF